MHLPWIKVICLSTLYLLLCNGCEKESDFLPGLKGDMVGYLYSFNEFGEALDEHGGFLITAIGLENIYQTYSDINGRFELKDLFTGTYELHLEKDGFGTLKQFEVKHLGGNPTILLNDGVNTKAYFLYQMSNTRILSMLVEDDILKGTFSFAEGRSPRRVSLHVYLSTTDGFDTKEAQYTFATNLFQTDGGYQFPLRLPSNLFQDGETVYFRAGAFTRPENWNLPEQNRTDFKGPDHYPDHENSQIIYPNLGELSDQFSFTYQP